MKYIHIKNCNDAEFRRLTGIKRKTFEKIVNILIEAEKEKKKEGGKPNKLSIEERVLMLLEYWREYRTYFHISVSYGVSESACFRNIKWMEDVLKEHPDFKLPGRKAVQKNDSEYEIILIDATETPIERPKKNKKTIIPAKKSAIL